MDGSPNPYEKFEIVANFLKLELRKIFTKKQAYLPALKNFSWSEFFKNGIGFENGPILTGQI